MDTPTTFEELVEFRARTICETPEEQSVTITKYDGLPENWKEHLRNVARATIIAEYEAGLLVVPAEATEEMEVAAAVAWQKIWTGWAHVLNAANAAGALRPREEVDDRQQG